MKGIQLWLIAIVAITVLGVAGCKKDSAIEPVSQTPDTSRKYFVREIKTSNSFIKYTYYDDELTLLSSALKRINNVDTIYSMAYNDLGQPLSFSSWSNGVTPSETQYTLNADGEVVRGDVYSMIPGGWDYTPDTLKSYYILTYNTSKQLTQVSYYYPNGEKDHDEFFDYTTDGNISGVNSSVDINLEYDSSNGFAKNIKYAHLFYIEGADQLIFHNKNNPTKLNGASRTYKYNHDNYPLEMTIQNVNGPQVLEINYYVRD